MNKFSSICEFKIEKVYFQCIPVRGNSMKAFDVLFFFGKIVFHLWNALHHYFSLLFIEKPSLQYNIKHKKQCDYKCLFCLNILFYSIISVKNRIIFLQFAKISEMKKKIVDKITFSLHLYTISSYIMQKIVDVFLIIKFLRNKKKKNRRQQQLYINGSKQINAHTKMIRRI